MAKPRFTTEGQAIEGINEPSAGNYLGCERIPTAGDHLEPKHFVVIRVFQTVKDRDRAPALSRRQLLRMGEDQQ